MSFYAACNDLMWMKTGLFLPFLWLRLPFWLVFPWNHWYFCSYGHIKKICPMVAEPFIFKYPSHMQHLTGGSPSYWSCRIKCTKSWVPAPLPCLYFLSSPLHKCLNFAFLHFQCLTSNTTFGGALILTNMGGGCGGRQIEGLRLYSQIPVYM